MSNEHTFAEAHATNIGGSPEAVAAAMQIMGVNSSADINKFVDAQASVVAAPNSNVHRVAEAMIGGRTFEAGQQLEAPAPSLAYAEASPADDFVPSIGGNGGRGGAFIG